MYGEPSAEVIAMRDKSSAYDELFFNSIHLSTVSTRVPAHAISLMMTGCVNTYTFTGVDVAAFPAASYAATDIALDALAVKLSVATAPVVVATITSFTAYA